MAKRVRLLTEAAVEKAKPGPSRREIPDGGGLYLIVHSSGLKSWAVRYRRDGRPCKLTLAGSYPAIGLKDARTLAAKALQAVAHGHDPAAAKKRARIAALDKESAFPAAVVEFLNRYITRRGKRPRERTIEQIAWVLGFEKGESGWTPVKGRLADKWRSKKMSDITKADVRAILDGLLARGVPILANRTWAVLKWFLSWAIRRELLATSPLAAIERPSAEVTRERVLSDDEIRILWKACDQEPVYGPLWKYLLLTGCRREEARAATWAEFDIPSAIWTIPAARTKNARQHALPLSRAALEILDRQPRIAGPGFVFTTGGKVALGGLSAAKARLDKRMADLAKASIPAFVTHDLRRTCATGLARLGTPPHITEKVLNHASGTLSGVAGIYQRYNYADEMRAALDAWARHVEAIMTGEPAAVIPIRRGGR